MSESRHEKDLDEVTRLREENARLKSLLAAHGVPLDGVDAIEPGAVREPPPERGSRSRNSYRSAPEPPPEQGSQSPAAAERIALFRSLFRGRNDVYALRWESRNGRSGYSPACDNEWKPGICQKPRIKCADCDQRQLLPITDQVIYDHLAGNHTIGIYPLLSDDTCRFLVADFDASEWSEDARAFIQSCTELEVPAALEVSRSGAGAHVWIFFSGAVPAREARRMGSALISYTCARTRQLNLTSYDRLFPNQDTLPKGGFGNLIALPLQKMPRDEDRSVFVDELFEPYADQWAFLASTTRINAEDVEIIVQRATGGGNPLDVSVVEDEDSLEPWKRPRPVSDSIPGPLPESLTLVLANKIFIEKAHLPQPLANRLIRLAAFQNPEFYKAQAMRLPVWNKPRVIGCADNYAKHIGLPRGCLRAVMDLLVRHDIKAEIQDERGTGSPINVDFKGTLRPDQKLAVEALMAEENGVLCAPAAFGKTVTAAALIARRRVSTLILVHRTELLRQWQERLTAFLDMPKDGLGVIGGGKKKPSGRIDIAVMQSLSRWEDLPELLESYGQVIVDECHHVSAFSFESILKRVRARFIVGLTATPVRRDGHHPIIFMQCGPIRHTAGRHEAAPARLEVIPRMLSAPPVPAGAGIQDVFRVLYRDNRRNQQIARDIIAAYREGRKILVLTERTEHLDLLKEALGKGVASCFQLHGRMSKKQRTATLEALTSQNDSDPLVLIATGRLIGEGFDHPPLDTLLLAMPISWKGTLQQYAGRLHRECTGKRDVRIYDYVEPNHAQLARMWEKRLRGYRAMGYTVRRQTENGLFTDAD